MSYANRTAVITGASGGIGRSLAVALAKAGARVGAIARREELLQELVREVRTTGGTIEAAAADVSDRAGLTAAIRKLEAVLGPTDLLIANAGVGLPSQAGPDHANAVETMTKVNFLGVVYAFDAVMGAMIARNSGHLVAVASLAAYKGLPGAAGYCASKAAVMAYCETHFVAMLRQHRGAIGVRCRTAVRELGERMELTFIRVRSIKSCFLHPNGRGCSHSDAIAAFRTRLQPFGMVAWRGVPKSPASSNQEWRVSSSDSGLGEFKTPWENRDETGPRRQSGDSVPKVALSLRERKAQFGPRSGCLPLAEREGYYFLPLAGPRRQSGDTVPKVALSLRERKAQFGPRSGCLPLAEREGYYFLPLA